MSNPRDYESELKAFDDTGYTRLCPRCVTRYGNNPFKRGKPREVTLEICKDCEPLKMRTYDNRFVVVRE